MIQGVGNQTKIKPQSTSNINRSIIAGIVARYIFSQTSSNCGRHNKPNFIIKISKETWFTLEKSMSNFARKTIL